MDDPVIRTYFMKGLVLKLIGAIGISIIYFYYYGTGDTVYYFERAKLIDSVLIDKFYVALAMLFLPFFFQKGEPFKMKILRRVY